MAYTPEQTERWTVIPCYCMAALIFVLFAGLGEWGLWRKTQLPQTHRPITVKVESLQTLCEVRSRLRRTTSNQWHFQSVHACEEARRVVAEKRRTRANLWRSFEEPYATVAYTAAGAVQEKLIRVSDLPALPIAAGDELPMYLDPSDPTRIERPVNDADYTLFWTLTLVGAGFGVFVAWIGRLFGRLNRKRQERALAAGNSVSPEGAVTDPRTTPDGTGIEDKTELWAKIVFWLVMAVLFVGLVFAVVGAMVENG